MWIGFFVFFYLKADEITKDPCSICAKKMGEEVSCRVGQNVILERTYLPNGSVVYEKPPQKLNDYSLNIPNASAS